jgi:Dyp-type peroxidase family
VERLDTDDIQYLLLSAYSRLSCASYVMLRVDDPTLARAWLGELAGKVTTAGRRREDVRLNVALTATGLRRLGLGDEELAVLPHAFRTGMASPRRARILGDVGPSAPDQWAWGGPDNPVDILLLLFAREEPTLRSEVAEHRTRAGAGGLVAVIPPLDAGRQPDTREHFGFNDGIGQPVIRGAENAERQFQRTQHATELAPGEFILGYVDTYGKPAPSPLLDPSRDPSGILPLGADPTTGQRKADLGRNGSYLVFRQLEQQVASFWQYLEATTRQPDGESDPAVMTRLAAKMIGRWPSGAPLVKYPDADPNAGTDRLNNENDFGYSQLDSAGLACPMGAHIRRANPRDSLGPTPQAALVSANRHRLLRRGRSYGERLADPLVDDGKKRGLYFICFNGDLERQFEFVQQTWLGSPVFGGLYGETDSIIGTQPLGGGTMTIPREPVRQRVHGLSRFVTVRGGAYFFLPGLRALKYLAAF